MLAYIPAPWILWDMGMGQNWVPKNTWMVNAVDAKNIEK
jgi:hypothetical protein